MTADIVGSVPWQCDGRPMCSAKGRWHKGTIWTDSSVRSGYTYDPYTDGDHTSISTRAAVQALRTAEAEWQRYAAYVVETGTDPLGNYMVDRERRFEEWWQADYAYAGVVYLVAAQRYEDQIWLDPSNVPADVLTFLSVQETNATLSRWVVSGFATLTELQAAAKPQCATCEINEGYLRILVKVERRLPVSPEAITAQLRELAAR